jgi:hypothetical protein
MFMQRIRQKICKHFWMRGGEREKKHEKETWGNHMGYRALSVL